MFQIGFNTKLNITKNKVSFFSNITLFCLMYDIAEVLKQILEKQPHCGENKARQQKSKNELSWGYSSMTDCCLPCSRPWVQSPALREGKKRPKNKIGQVINLIQSSSGISRHFKLRTRQ